MRAGADDGCEREQMDASGSRWVQAVAASALALPGGCRALALGHGEGFALTSLLWGLAGLGSPWRGGGDGCQAVSPTGAVLGRAQGEEASRRGNGGGGLVRSATLGKCGPK